MNKTASLRWHNSNSAFLVVSLIMLVQFLATSAVLAQVPDECPYVCNGTYALCISATCDDQGNCGQGDTTNSGGGYCYVFEGTSCSYYGPCETSGLYSTYSENLLDTYGFQNQSCDALPGNSDCMGEICSLTGDSVKLKNINTGETDTVPTANCECTTPVSGAGTFQALYLNEGNCTVNWSTR